MSTPRLTELIEKSGASFELGIAKGLKTGTTSWLKIGYNPAITTNEEEIWAGGGAYAFPAAAAQWRIAGGNAADLGTVIKGNAEGANQTVKCDAGGDETTLIDASVDFSAATAVAVGDIVLLDPKGTVPEFGYVTDITDAATGTLVIGGGFSEGGSCATARAYTIVDKSDATGTGAQVLEIYYLTNAFVEKKILVALNAATAVDFKGAGGAALTDTYRLNGMRVVAVGTGGKAAAAIALQLQAAPNTVYGHILAGDSIDRAGIYTVPAGKTLYISALNLGAATPEAIKITSARVYMRADQEDYSGFRTGIMYPYFESMISNGSQHVDIAIPVRMRSGTDIKASAIGLTGFAGSVMCVVRGWLELN